MLISNQTRSGRGSFLAFVALGLVACSAPETATQGPKREAPTSVSAGPLSVVCGGVEVDGVLEPRIFMLSAINHKLAAFPDFAASIGLDSVSDCDGGQQFADGYVQYLRDHPDFDQDEPLDTTDYPRTLPPSDETSVLRAQKMLRGEPGLNNPVVRIGIEQPLCSGTFIAKNWILTAAHCMVDAATADCVEAGIPPTDPSCKPNWVKYAVWTIDFKRPDGTISSVETGGVYYVHPRWAGKNLLSTPGNDPTFGVNDVALVYLPDDRVLPPHVEEDGAKRISIVAPPDVNWPLSFFGWGLNPLGPDADLRQSVNPPPFSLDGRTIKATTTATNQSIVCSGDSGGPLVRTADVMVNSGQVRTVQVIVGVASSGSATHDECAGVVNPVTGRTAHWARTDLNYDFIENTIRRWNGNPITEQSGFRCWLRPVEGEGNDDQVAECWGTPCKGDSECLKSEYCSRPGHDFTTCPTCQDFPNDGSGPCGCITGQCLANPYFVEDGGTSSGP